MTAVHDPTASLPTPPSLRALLVYLRPTARARLLTLLAGLGVLVVEHQGAAHAHDTAFSTRTDLIIVVGEAVPEHTTLARELLEVLSSVLVAVVPPGTARDAYALAGAVVTIADDAPDEEFIQLFASVARQARVMRELGELAAELIIFHNIHFRSMPPELERDGKRVSLTRVESEVLGTLAGSVGTPVAATEIERRLGVDTHERGETGYAKTVIMRIRRKVEQVGGDPSLLRNVRGFGYLLAA